MTDGKPLTEAERFFIEAHASIPVAELAKALGRDAKELVTLMPKAKTSYEKKVAPIIRNGKRIGVVYSESASAHMDDVSGHAPGSTRTAPKPPMVNGVVDTTAGTQDDPHCIHVLRK